MHCLPRTPLAQGHEPVTFSATVAPLLGALLLYVGNRPPCLISTSSSVFFSSPRLRISPALGALSRGVCASRRRYAFWSASVLVYYSAAMISTCRPSQKPLRPSCQLPYLFPVVQALVVVVQYHFAFVLSRVVIGVGVDDVAGEHFLPEGKAPRGTCKGQDVSMRGLAWRYNGKCCGSDAPPARP
jgi:hypothetical protein